LIVPLVLLVLAGLVEVAFFMFSYLNAVDLTREAARFTSTRDYRQMEVTNPSGLPKSACVDDKLHFYYDAACFFIDPDLNPYIPITNTEFSDVTISVFTVLSNTVSDRWPDVGTPGVSTDNVWSLFNDNWKKDCDGNTIHSAPTFSNADVEQIIRANPSAPKNKGIVLIEVFYCYHQVLNLPILSQFIPSPFRVHTYTIMPAPEAIPTPTPIP
jgi:hypothetical protein